MTKEKYSIDAELGDLKLEVEGTNAAWVESAFMELWDQRLHEYQDFDERLRSGNKSYE